MTVPADLEYTADHEWVRLRGEMALVGITAYAADALGDVVYIQLPRVGESITGGSACGEIESTKSVSDLLAPADGTVLETNSDLLDNPGAVNADPYGAGWLIRIQVTGPLRLMDAEKYTALITDGS